MALFTFLKFSSLYVSASSSTVLIEEVAIISNAGELINKLQEKQMMIDKSQDQLFYGGELKVFQYER